MILCTTCRLPTLCWWAFDGQGGARWKCANCGASQPGPRVVENPAHRVRVAA